MKKILLLSFLFILLILPIALAASSEKIKLTSFSASIEENDLYINLGVESDEKTQLEIDVELASGITIIKAQKLLWYIDGPNTLKKKVMNDILGGNYSVLVSINDEIIKSIEFSVETVHNIVKSKIIEENPLYDIVTIYIRNEGNVVEEYYVEENVPDDKITGFVTKPNVCSDEKCGFYIEDLVPGATAKIVYRIEHWPYMFVYGLGIVAILFVGFLTFFKATNPRIKKRHTKKTNHVTIEVKNPYMRNVKNVVVRDWISPLARVHGKFDSVKPVIRKSEAGTELIWRIGNLAAKEERILSYKLRPLIEGSLKMPRAYMRFRDNKGRRLKIHSNQLVIKQ